MRRQTFTVVQPGHASPDLHRGPVRPCLRQRCREPAPRWRHSGEHQNLVMWTFRRHFWYTRRPTITCNHLRHCRHILPTATRYPRRRRRQLSVWAAPSLRRHHSPFRIPVL